MVEISAENGYNSCFINYFSRFSTLKTHQETSNALWATERHILECIKPYFSHRQNTHKSFSFDIEPKGYKMRTKSEWSPIFNIIITKLAFQFNLKAFFKRFVSLCTQKRNTRSNITKVDWKIIHDKMQWKQT